MFDTDADKYWKEKERARKAESLKRNAGLIAGVICLVVVAALVCYGFAGGEAVPEFTPPTPLELEEASAARAEAERLGLQVCRRDCHGTVPQACESECSKFVGERPNPTIFQSCISPCRKMAIFACDVATDWTLSRQQRTQCSARSNNQVTSMCMPYENAVPRPRRHKVCKTGVGRVFKPRCVEAIACGDAVVLPQLPPLTLEELQARASE